MASEIKTTTIANLTEKQDISNDDVLIISEKLGSGSTTNYVSKKVTYSSFKNDLKNTITNELPKATTSTLGVVQIGSGIAVNNGIINVDTLKLQVANNNNLGVIKTGYTKTDNEFALEVVLSKTTTNGQAFVTIPNATTTSPGLMTKDEKTKLDGIEAGATAYVLPQATEDALGGIKIGYIELTVEGGKNYAVKLVTDGDDKDKAYVTIPTAESYILPTATAEQLGGIKTGYIELTVEGGKNYAVKLVTDGDDKDKAYVTIPTSESYILPTATTAQLGGIKTGYNKSTNLNHYPVNVINSNTSDNGKAYAIVDNATSNVPGVMSTDDKLKLDQVPEPSTLVTLDLIPIQSPAIIEECEELISAGKTDFLDATALNNLAAYTRIKYSNGLVEYAIRTKPNTADFTIPFYDFLNNESIVFSTSYIMVNKSTSAIDSLPRISLVNNMDFFLGCNKNSAYSESILVKGMITNPDSSNMLTSYTLNYSNIAYHISPCFIPLDTSAVKQRILVRVSGIIKNNGTNANYKSKARIFLYRNAKSTVQPKDEVKGIGLDLLVRVSGGSASVPTGLRYYYTGNASNFTNIWSNNNNAYVGIGYDNTNKVGLAKTINVSKTLTLASAQFPMRIGIECCDVPQKTVLNKLYNTCNFENLKIEVFKIGIA